MIAFLFIFITSFSIFSIIKIYLYVILNNDFDTIFSKNLLKFYNDYKIYKNFFKFNNTDDIYKIRKIAKYRKIGYGGHPVQYLFSTPLDEKVSITPHINYHKITLLIFLHTRPEEFYERFMSRKCNYKSKEVLIIYITSKSNDHLINKMIKYESHIYKDILQFNELSSYFNLSLQTLHMLKWSINIYFKYILKSDIDVYINISLILEYIKKFNSTYKYYAIGKISKAYVIRNKKYSHYVPYEVIKENIFPPYLQGVGYIIPYNTVTLLIKSIEKINPRIWIEDVYMGYMFKYNNVKLIDLSKYIIRDLPHNISLLLANINNYMLIHGFYPIEIYMIKEKNKLCRKL